MIDLRLIVAGIAIGTDAGQTTAPPPPPPPLLGAFYYGDFHVDPQMSQIHGPNWTEFDVVVNAKPRFPGHLQPNIPMAAPGFGIAAPENDPTVMAAKIDAAVDNGLGLFVFDWYWYASPSRGGIDDLQGKDGGVFLGGAINDGFLKAPNNNKMKFAIMWANQDWVDIHPAKKGWHSTYRAPGKPYFGPNVSIQQLQMFDGYMTAEVYQTAFKYIAQNYFSKPNYYRVPTKLPNGTTANCCFFSFYQPEYVAMGNTTAGDALMDAFRSEAESVGECLHLNHMGTQDHLIKQRGVNSIADYGWIKLGKSPDFSFPETPYEVVAGHALTQLETRHKFYTEQYNIPYVPSMSTAWDSSPRTLPSDEYGDFGYPWGTSWHSNVSQWSAAAKNTIRQSMALCGSDDWCPPILINAWNEWSEGAYLEPDQRYGFGKLQALKAALEATAL